MKYELYEKYSSDGVCIERKINGVDLPTDTEPSIVLLQDHEWVATKRYISEQEADKLKENLTK
jgi:hypothetical protein